MGSIRSDEEKDSKIKKLPEDSRRRRRHMIIQSIHAGVPKFQKRFKAKPRYATFSTSIIAPRDPETRKLNFVMNSDYAIQHNWSPEQEKIPHLQTITGLLALPHRPCTRHPRHVHAEY